ncbi:MAG: glycerol kinase GlpK [Acidobacteria bacterium]|jgi:glycerol kinase|nr:glycerol kinase GlpK [Acidobacteriota bacterium]
MRETIVLALDQGTTATTALVFGPAGEVLGRAASEFTQHYPEPGWVEHDAEEIWETSRRVMVDALAASGAPAAALKAIGITNQRETAVVWDRSTGKPVHRAVVWQSRQTAAICARLKAEGHEPLFHQRTGLVLDPYFSGTKVRWILDQDEERQRRAEAGELAFGTIDSWLVSRMTGGRVHATEPTNASRTLLYDIHRQAWDDQLLAVLQVPAAMLPEVRPSSGVFGETAGVEGVPDGVPIAGIAGDQQAALFGQGCWEPGMAKNTYGTGAFLVLNTGDRPVISERGLLTTLCCDARGQAAYALEGSIFIAGAAVQWLRDELGLVENAAQTEEVATSVSDTGGVYLVPAFAGLGAPWWDPDARGAILGLTRGSGRAHIVRAALESIAYQTADVADVMNDESGVLLKELRVDGGAAANGFLMQFQADILGVPVDRPALLETTAAGAALLAGLAVGVWPSAEALSGTRVRDRLFEPTMDPEDRTRLRAEWRAAVGRVRSV